MNCPEEHELIWLFESEPVLMDPGERWYYNTATFTTRRASDQVACAISPSYGDLEVWWERDGNEILHVALSGIESVRVVRESGAELLEATFAEEKRLQPFLLRLKPTVHISWGTTIQ